MKKIKRWLSEIFDPREFNDLDIAAVSGAFNDSSVRLLWLNYCFDELKRMNTQIDTILLLESGSHKGLLVLSARRKAFQDILEQVLSARRQVTQGVRHNPQVPGGVNLDRVTE